MFENLRVLREEQRKQLKISLLDVQREKEEERKKLQSISENNHQVIKKQKDDVIAENIRKRQIV